MSRKHMPRRRGSWTQKIVLEGQTFHVGFGEYADGSLGEIWIDAHKAGSAMRAMMNTAAIHASTSLQYGMPLGEIVGNLKMMDFPPNGTPENLPELGHVRSVLDVVGRLIEQHYMRGTGIGSTAEAQAS